MRHAHEGVHLGKVLSFTTTAPWLVRTLPLVAVAIVVGATAAQSQAVQGTVIDGAGASPLRGAVVVLLDSSNAARATALTDEEGKFFVRAPAAGSYRLRVDVIGSLSETQPELRLAEGETLTRTFHYQGRARDLPPVKVTARARCAPAASGGDAVAVLWDEVRKALSVTQLTLESQRYRFDLSEYERELDPKSGAVRRSQNWERSGVAGHGYASVDAESLAAHGYVRTTSEGTWYYAPDARTLLSDAFVRTHCLRPVAPGATDAGLAGLGFEPIAGRKVPDVHGVLWIDVATARLRYLDYRYTGLSRGMNDHELGGRVEFARLESGAWIVQDWRIRMPRVSRQTRSMPSSIPEAGPARLVPTTTEVVVGVIERGGRITPHALPRVARLAAIVGSVFDSAQGRPLADAEIWLDVPGRAVPAGHVTTDSLGAFRIEGLEPGTYTLTATHPRLEALGVAIPPLQVELLGGQATALTVSAPSLRAALDALCPARSGPDDGVVRGIVARTGEGPSIGEATVRARWTRDSLTRELSTGAAPPQEIEVATDAGGRFTLCGLPSRRSIVLRATDARSRGVAHPVTLDSGGLQTVTLLAPEHDAEISGVVTAKDGRRVAAAEIRIPALDIAVRSDPSGAFSLDKLPGGRHTLEARAIGYSPVTREVAVDAKGRATANIVLSVAVPVLRSVQTVARRDPYRTGFAERMARRAGGHFLTDQQIRASGQTRVTELLRTIPGLQIRKRGDIAVMEFTGRGGRTFSSHGCPVAYFVDGAAYELAFWGLDGELAVDDIEAIEAYDAATAPAEFTRRGTGCGVILIWTRQQAVRDDEQESRRPRTSP